ncbi:amidohydrolase [Sporosarcina limicola]|uniref:Aminobenzoyl-glutamate utilization protein A n=1 Tax=Sporosarcina limicola TaxID=34101 RepID=A0A927MK16_9BACL|nr:amidohydrolase [Sporosarcina limicola]MBE1555805.1 aminobenzoyl-glutamate utilization protein A [Sporosarcina limicola]
MNHSHIDAQTQALQEKLVEWRRALHQLPETGFLEFQTTAFILSILSTLSCELFVGDEVMSREARKGLPAEKELNSYYNSGLPIDRELLEKMRGGMTGCVAVFDSKIEGPHTVVRFDIDALPVEETEMANHFPVTEGFASARFGSMHACGHDGHAAIGLGVAHLLNDRIGEFTGKITLLFQPAEEGGRGAQAIVSKGWTKGADYFLSGHIGFLEEPVGTVALTTNHFLASTKLDVSFVGESVHAGKSPEEGRNALLSAASAAIHLNGITRHSGGATRINVGMLNAGSGRNIVADKASMIIETRGATTKLNDYMRNEAERIIQASALLFNTTAHIEEAGYAQSATCDAEWIEWGSEALQGSCYVNTILPETALGASEDATAYINDVQSQGGKATYIIIASPLKAPHHHPEFDYDEKVLPVAVSTFTRLLSYHHSRNNVKD